MITSKKKTLKNNLSGNLVNKLIYLAGKLYSIFNIKTQAKKDSRRGVTQYPEENYVKSYVGDTGRTVRNSSRSKWMRQEFAFILSQLIILSN